MFGVVVGGIEVIGDSHGGREKGEGGVFEIQWKGREMGKVFTVVDLGENENLFGYLYMRD